MFSTVLLDVLPWENPVPAPCRIINLPPYSKTQAVIAKSSGESELYAVVRASTEALGILTLLKDFGLLEMRASVGMDASAAIGIVQRQGISKLRPVEVDVLWIQEQQARLRISSADRYE